MKLALLGTGNEAQNAYASLIMAGHEVQAVSDPALYDSAVSENPSLVLVDNHTHLDYSIVGNILLISYAPLIHEEWMSQASFMNIHCAVLPKYRGMHPIQWAIVNGEKQYGYTLHLVDKGIDSGPVIYQGTVNFDAVPDYGQVKSKINELIHKTLGKALLNYERTGKSVPQNDRDASYFAKRHPEDGMICWNKRAYEIYCLTQAILPPEMPGAYFYYKGRKVIVAESYEVDIPDYIGPTGKVVCIKDKDVYIKCGRGVIALRSLICDGEQRPASSLLTVVGASVSQVEGK